MKRIFLLVIILLFLLTQGKLVAQNREVVINEHISELDLSPSMQVLREIGNRYSFSEVSSGKLDSSFSTSLLINSSDHSKHKYYWAKLVVRSGYSIPTTWVLETDKQYSEVECYIVYPDGKVLFQKSGWEIAPVKRTIQDPNVIFKFQLTDTQRVIIYMHVHANLKYSTVRNIKAKLIEYGKWNKEQANLFYFFALYGGICLLATFYWLINFIYSNRINYIYLIAATISIFLVYADYYGFTAEILWHDYPWYFLAKYGLHLWIPFIAISNASIVSKLNHFDTHFSTGVLKFFWLSAYTAIFCPILVTLLFNWETTFSIIWLSLPYGTAVIYCMLFFLWLKKKKRSAGFALIAYFPAVVGFLVFNASHLGIVSADNRLVGPVGGLITVVLLFYGMVNYVRALRHKREKELIEKEKLIQEQNAILERKVEERTHELEVEKIKANELYKKSEDLLLNILPAEAAEELKNKGRSSAKTYSLVSVMFIDFKGFSNVSERVSAELLVSELDYCFSAFDEIVQNHGLEKIKTVGDAYICTGGMPLLTYTHAEDIINAAIEIRAFMSQRKIQKELKREIPFEARIGIHSGPVVAGIVGVKKFAYDIWGDTVNIAARMEQNSDAGKINISETTYELVKDKFTCTYRGEIEAKNKGMMKMYFVEG